jgi:Dihydrofolate reductase
MITLDGVIQAPGGPEEDKSGRFKYGGWVAPFSDETYGKAMQEEMKPADILLGRKTFDIFENYWPENADAWPGINEVNKYVVSKKRKKSDWNNSVFFKSVTEIKKLKNTKGGDIKVWGSSQVVQLLLKNDLVDELWLKIHPVILGKGKRLFDESSAPTSLTLINSLVTSSGVIVAYYKKGGKVKTGTIGE